jgi:hypothetical protein
LFSTSVTFLDLQQRAIQKQNTKVIHKDKHKRKFKIKKQEQKGKLTKEMQKYKYKTQM